MGTFVLEDRHGLQNMRYSMEKQWYLCAQIYITYKWYSDQEKIEAMHDVIPKTLETNQTKQTSM